MAWCNYNKTGYPKEWPPRRCVYSLPRVVFPLNLLLPWPHRSIRSFKKLCPSSLRLVCSTQFWPIFLQLVLPILSVPKSLFFSSHICHVNYPPGETPFLESYKNLRLSLVQLWPKYPMHRRAADVLLLTEALILKIAKTWACGREVRWFISDTFISRYWSRWWCRQKTPCSQGTYRSHPCPCWLSWAG